MPKRRSNTDRDPLTPEQKVEITKLHYEGATQQQLAKRFKKSPATINRAVKNAHENGWITLTVTSNLVTTDRDDDLARRLLARYDNVSNLFVLKSPATPGLDDDSYADWSDGVHSMVGRFLGRTHVRHAIADGDSIGVSSGRGVSHTIEGVLQESLPLQAQNVNLVSLTGSFEMRGQSNSASMVMDGDNNVGRLAQGFGRWIRLHTTGRGIVVGSKKESQGQDVPWVRTPPDRALVGVGVIERANRILSKTSVLEPIRPMLDELEALVRAAARDSYVPCADICNYLFWVPPPKGVMVNGESKIRKQIEEINARLYVMPLDKLASARGGVWIAAATGRKAAAIKEALRLGLRINALCIDTTLAREFDQLE